MSKHLHLWDDGGAFDDLLQKHMAKAIREYVEDGYINLDPGTMRVEFVARDPMEDAVCRIDLVELLEMQFHDYTNPARLSELAHKAGSPEAARENLRKIEECLKILRGTTS